MKRQSLQTLLILCAVPLMVSCLKPSLTQTNEWSVQYGAGLKDLASNKFDTAESHLLKAIALSAGAPDSKTRLIDSQFALARLYNEQGRYASAKKVLQSATKTTEELFGPDSRRTAAAILELSACHFRQAEYEDAEPLLRRALEIEQKVLKSNDLLIGATLNNFAQVEHKLGRDEQAEKYFREALAVYSANTGDAASKGLIDTYNNLAMFYKKQERIEEARTAIGKAIDIEHEHPKLAVAGQATSLNTLASIERSQFNYDEAIDNYKEAVKLLSSHPKEHEEMLCDTLDNYADLLLDEHNLQEAEVLYLTAIEHCKSARGADHPCVAERMRDLALLYRRLGQFEKAAPLLTRVLEIDKASFEADSPITFDNMNDLSATYLALKRYGDAQKVYADWVPVMKKVLGPEHPHVADALENWALVATRSSNPQAALQLTSEAKSIRTRMTQKPASVTVAGPQLNGATAVKSRDHVHSRTDEDDD